jgi:hypothetical protein
MKTENQPDKLDRILLEDGLHPSSGFAASVMDAIHQETLAPTPITFSPIPFPWLRAVPGFLALLVALITMARYAVLATRNIELPSTLNTDWFAWYRSSAQTAVFMRSAVVPALLALACSFACVALCRRFTLGRVTR